MIDRYDLGVTIATLVLAVFAAFGTPITTSMLLISLALYWLIVIGVNLFKSKTV